MVFGQINMIFGQINKVKSQQERREVILQQVESGHNVRQVYNCAPSIPQQAAYNKKNDNAEDKCISINATREINIIFSCLRERGNESNELTSGRSLQNSGRDFRCTIMVNCQKNQYICMHVTVKGFIKYMFMILVKG